MQKESFSNTEYYIVEALFRLLKTKSLDKIQVIEICKIAGVGRSTFYKHFINKNEIVVFYLNKVYKQYLKKAIKHPKNNQEFESNIVVLVQTIYDHKENLSLLLKNNLGQKLLDFLTRKFIVIDFLLSNENYFLPYIISGAIYNSLIARSENNFRNEIKEVTNSIIVILKLYNLC